MNSDDPSPPPTDTPEQENISPRTIVYRSILCIPSALIIHETLKWDNHLGGLVAGAFTGLIFGLPLYLILWAIQGVLALIFMRNNHRSWWRTSIVVSPAALIVLVILIDTILLFPPERHAKSSLQAFLGGPIPESAKDFQLRYTGGLDPIWNFEFTTTPDDYQTLATYHDYGESSRPTSSDSLSAQDDERNYFYELDYDPKTQRCQFKALNW